LLVRLAMLVEARLGVNPMVKISTKKWHHHSMDSSRELTWLLKLLQSDTHDDAIAHSHRTSRNTWNVPGAQFLKIHLRPFKSQFPG
jgi:hypothetical protein